MYILYVCMYIYIYIYMFLRCALLLSCVCTLSPNGSRLLMSRIQWGSAASLERWAPQC